MVPYICKIVPLFNGSETSTDYGTYVHGARTNAKGHVALPRAGDEDRGLEKAEMRGNAVEDGLEYLRRGARQAAFNIFDKVWAFESVDARLVNPRASKTMRWLGISLRFTLPTFSPRGTSLDLDTFLRSSVSYSPLYFYFFSRPVLFFFFFL